MITNSIVLVVIVTLTVLATSLESRPGLRMTRVPTGTLQSHCEDWQSTVSKLSNREKEILAKEGAVYNGNLILSERMVGDCNLRGQMSSYFGKVLRGETDEVTREFAAGHSREIVGVLRRIWPSTSNCAALTPNGNVDAEKYSLLADSALQSRVVAPLIAEIVAKERLGNNLAYVLLSRPIPQLRQSMLVNLR